MDAHVQLVLSQSFEPEGGQEFGTRPLLLCRIIVARGLLVEHSGGSLPAPHRHEARRQETCKNHATQKDRAGGASSVSGWAVVYLTLK